jgi:non-lysosomal glucosylceramidase
MNNGKVNSYLTAAHAAAAFPLGGVGTGNVSLGSRGNLRDWEIFNSANKGFNLPNTFFAIRVQAANQAPITRVLEGQIQAPHDLSHGYHPAANAGLPRFKNTILRGEYPLATIDFEDDRMPVKVRLEAFTPLIPLNPEDSGIPCAILTYYVTNTSSEAVNLTIAGSLCNPVGGVNFDTFGNIRPLALGKSVNTFREEESLRGLYMEAQGIADDNLLYGNVSLVTTHPNVTVKPAWRRGSWWDFLREFWDDFAEDGLLNDLGYNEPAADSKPDTGSLGVVDTVAAGASQSYTFIISWYFPNRKNTWSNRPGHSLALFSDAPEDSPAARYNNAPTVRNHYTTRFTDAWDVANYVVSEWERLKTGTQQFHDAMFDSTLPAPLIDAVASNIVPVRSNTCFWLEDGRFYGWEGCFDEDGCCAGTCTHVWSYAYTVAYLFPSLEREMRRIEFAIETNDSGFMNFRNFTSMNETFKWTFAATDPEAAVDGQMGSILRAYREWKLSGDKAWLDNIWGGIKRAIGFASSQWDADMDGVLDGKQHNTYDIEFFGPNPLSSIYYLAALRAVEELATIMGETQLAQRCRQTFEKGSQKLDTLLWNGEYYIQQLDDVDAYMYQHGTGCLADQLLGQLHASVLGLGDLLPRDHLKQAIHAVYANNFRENFSDHVNAQRTYVLNDEAGLVMCTWKAGATKPRFPFVYSDEAWTGIEYHVAAHLLYEGWHSEGLRVVEAARQRHDGIRRNPWDEVECGHHYARTMSSWMLLLVATGFDADASKKQMSFAPLMDISTAPDKFSSFWSNGIAWGTFTQQKTGDSWSVDIQVLGGALGDTQVMVNGMPVNV